MYNVWDKPLVVDVGRGGGGVCVNVMCILDTS